MKIKPHLGAITLGIAMAFAFMVTPHATERIDPGIYDHVTSVDLDIIGALEEFHAIAAAMVPAPGMPEPEPAIVAVARPEILAPVYRMSLRTDAHNIISPHMLC